MTQEAERHDGICNSYAEENQRISDENVALRAALDRAEAEKAELQEKLAQREYDCRAELAAIDAANTLRAELESTRDELEATRTRESKLETSITEIGQRSHVLETRRNELHSKLEQEMLECDALRAALDREKAEKAELQSGSDLLSRQLMRSCESVNALRAKLAAVREALEPFSRLLDTDGSGYESSADDEIVRSIGTLGRDYQFITVGDLRTARTALQSHRRTEEAT